MAQHREFHSVLLTSSKPFALQARNACGLDFFLPPRPPLNPQVRADCALSTAIMGRGEKVYRYQLAAMYLATLARIGLTSVLALCIVNLSDKTTTNQRQYVSVLQHKDALLCPILAIAMALFQRWEVAGFNRPDFSSRAAWYPDFLFPGFGPTANVAINPATVGSYIKETFTAVQMTTKTCMHHFFRYFGAALLSAFGVALSTIELLGGWNQTVFTQVYVLNMKPRDGLVAAAGFDADDIKNYNIPRSAVVPPPELAALIFPWADAELQAARARVVASSPADVDTAAVKFLEVVVYFRSVLLQGMAVLWGEYKDTCALFRHAAFQSAAFLEFKDTVVASVAAATSDAGRLAAAAVSRQAETAALAGAIGGVQAGQQALATQLNTLAAEIAAGHAAAAAREAAAQSRFAAVAGAAAASAAAAAAAAAASANLLHAVGQPGGAAAMASANAQAAAAVAASAVGQAGGGTPLLTLAPHTAPPQPQPPTRPQQPPTRTLRPMLSLEALATVAKLVEEWNCGLNGRTALCVHDKAITEERKAVAEAAVMKPGVRLCPPSPPSLSLSLPSLPTQYAFHAPVRKPPLTRAITDVQVRAGQAAQDREGGDALRRGR